MSIIIRRKMKQKKLQKNISPELLAGFDRQLTKTEDIKSVIIQCG